ncbi:MAG: alanine dehydrogenase [Alphaproteobacteria bacterium]|nr:alanine dehydrogenase [Alphaproteobacteria bacterium]MCL2505975.1 alanine dehydrogenase [Alphaproteobacteria bacterium]
MIIGTIKEIKNNENRVGITPAGVSAFVGAGHSVLIETNAGVNSGFSDADYTAAGAKILDTAKDVWSKADMIIKVKEPIAQEREFLREGLILFTYLHLASEPELTRILKDSGVTAIAYETVQVGNTLPLLTPMSEVAGRMSVQIGAHFLEKSNGGKGIMLGGVPGVKKASVVIIGGGVVGRHAAKMALGLGADVMIIDISVERLRELDDVFSMQLKTVISNPYNIAEAVKNADLLIGAVLIPGAKAPKLVTRDMVKSMQPGSVIVDVAIDQSGCIESCDHPTTHADPVYTYEGVLHYTVANMPGAVACTSTLALTNATMPYALEIANKGVKKAILDNPALRLGVNVAGSEITHEAVAKDLGYTYIPADKALDNI